MAMILVKPDDALLIDLQDEAEKQGLVLVTDGRELKYLPRGWPMPDGHTPFRMRPKRGLHVVDPKAPRL